MTVSLDDVMKKFTPAQRAQVEARAAELIEEELTQRLPSPHLISAGEAEGKRRLNE